MRMHILSQFSFERVFSLKSKKLLSAMLAVIMILSCFSCLTVVSSAAIANGSAICDKNGMPTGKYTWTIVGTALTINSFSDTTGIPNWLEYSADIKTATVADTAIVDEEGNYIPLPAYAFYGCKNLKNVELPFAITAIGAHSFDGCTSLTTINTIGNVTGIVELPISISSIGDYAFFGCTALTSVKLGGAINSVGENIFKGCSALKNVTVSNGLTKIADGMFCDCSSITSIEIPDSVQTIGAHAFDGCTALNSVNIPDSVTSVDGYAFYGCSSIVSASIGRKLTSVGAYVFGGCKELTTVTVKTGADCFGNWMFTDCAKLATVDIPAGITKIGTHCFEGTALTSVVIPNSVVVIDDNAFSECTKLANVTLGNSLVRIPKQAFYKTAITSIDIPYSVETIADGAFSSCTALTAINVPETNVDFRSVDGILYDAAVAKLLICPAGKVGSVVVPSSVKEINNNAFMGCQKVTDVTIPSNVTNIPDNAFNGVSADLVIKTTCTSAAALFAEVHGIKSDITHDGNETWVTTKAPTCTEAGQSMRVCDKCNKSPVDLVDTKVIEALGHSYTSVVTTEPGCTTEGVRTFTCERCGDSYTEPVAKLGHSYGEGVVTLEASCEADGEKTFTCSRCGDYYVIKIPATGHSYNEGVVTLKPTCEDEGITTYTCSKCGDFYTKPIKALGHNYSSKITKEATCTEDGVKTYTCANCDDEYTEVILATGHNFDEGVITKKPTCYETGIKTYTCKNCGETKTDVLPVQHYVYPGWMIEKAATCTEDGLKYHQCAVCKEKFDYTVIPATGHNYVNGYCTVCGEWDGVTIVLKTPALVSAENAVSGVTVTWKAVSDASKYVVYRKTTGSWETLATVTGTSYVDTTAKNGVTYTYTVRAANDTAKSDFDAKGISVYFLSTPSLISATNVTKGVTVKWSRNAASYGYYVYRRTANSGWSRIKVIGSKDTTSYTDTTVSNNKTYIYTVRALGSDCKSYFVSRGVSTHYLVAPKLGTIKNVGSGVNFTWTSVPGVSGYIIYRKANNGSWKRLTIVKGSSKTSYTDKVAKSGITYTYTVRSYIGKSVSAVDLKGLTSMFLASPKLSSATYTSSGATFKFNKVSAATSYVIYRREAGGSWKKLATTTSTTYKDVSVRKGATKYYYTVRAVNGNYRSSYYSGVLCK